MLFSTHGCKWVSVNFPENLIHAGSREGRGSVNNDGKNPIQQEDSSSKTPDRHMQWGIGQAQAVSATTWCARCRLRKYCIFTFFDAGIPPGRSCEITPLRLKKRETNFLSILLMDLILSSYLFRKKRSLQNHLIV